MEFFTILGIILIIYYTCYVILLCLVDCNLSLAFCQLFGKRLSKLQGKVIWITGASSGIGEAMAYEVARQGGKLVLSARSADKLELVRERCLQLQPNIITPSDIFVLPMDVTAFSTHRSCFNAVIEKFGQVDILINNAGRSQRAKWEEIDLEVDRQMIDLNVFGVLSLSRVVVPYFVTRGRGQVAVTSSLAGIIGVPFSASYSATKHAIHGYFESLRTEMIGSKIFVTLLCPGPVFSNFLEESFTAVPNQKYGVPVQRNDRRMTAERCAKLSLIAIVNKLDTAWIALFPIIPLLYALVYHPDLSRLAVKYIGAKGFHKLRDSRDTMNVA